MTRLAPGALQSATPRRGLDGIPAHLAILAVSSLLLGLAFPRPGWGFLAHVALVPAAVLALRSARPRRVLWTSYLVAWAWWLVMIAWMIPVTGPGYAALAGYMAVYTPASLLLLRWLVRRCRLPATLALPMAWVSLEYIRCNFLQGGFGWFALGHSQAPYLPEHGDINIIQVAELFGQHAVSFLVAMTNGLVIDLLTRPLMRRDRQRRFDFRTVATACAIAWLALFGGALLFGKLLTLGRSPAVVHAPSVNIAVIQTNVPQDNKDNPAAEQRGRDWQRMLRLTVDASTWKASHMSLPDRVADELHLIVWPETMVPASVNPEAVAYYETAETGENGDQVFHQQIQDLARGLNTPLLVGANSETDWKPVTSRDGQEFILAQRQFNSAILYLADGSQSGRYDKIHRVPFGEYIPWVEGTFLKDWFLRTLSPYDFDYTIQPGTSYTAFELPAAQGTVRFGAPICFEDTIPKACRRMIYGNDGKKRADLLVNLTNDGWFANTDQPLQQLQIATLRCVENRVPMARSVNTGPSGFIDSMGRVVSLVRVGGKSLSVEGWDAATLALDPRTTLYGRIGDSAVIGLAVVTGLVALAGAWWRRGGTGA